MRGGSDTPCGYGSAPRTIPIPRLPLPPPSRLPFSIPALSLAFRRPGQLYGPRAWLFFEAGRRSDLDLTALSPSGDYVPASEATPTSEIARAWWRRAIEHAQGPAAAEYYAMLTARSLLARDGVLTQPAWVHRTVVVAADLYCSQHQCSLDSAAGHTVVWNYP